MSTYAYIHTVPPYEKKIIQSIVFKTVTVGAGEIARWLGAEVVLSKALVSMASMYLVAHSPL